MILRTGASLGSGGTTTNSLIFDSTKALFATRVTLISMVCEPTDDVSGASVQYVPSSVNGTSTFNDSEYSAGVCVRMKLLFTSRCGVPSITWNCGGTTKRVSVKVG